jgi:hypothetical protein
VVGKILENDTYAYGFDAQTGEFGNLVTKGGLNRRPRLDNEPNLIAGGSRQLRSYDNSCSKFAAPNFRVQ